MRSQARLSFYAILSLFVVVLSSLSVQASSTPSARPTKPVVGHYVVDDRVALADHQRAVQVAAKAAQDEQAFYSRQAELARSASTVSRSYERHVYVQTAGAAGSVYPMSNAAIWACIRQHESGDNYADKANPNYRGAYQFSWATWRSVGGTGDPADASPAEQDMRAQMLQRRSGWGQWSTAGACGV